MEADRKIAACQPKLLAVPPERTCLNMQAQQVDGWITSDIHFVKGRIFDVCENDEWSVRSSMQYLGEWRGLYLSISLLS
jgi:hypothetical protein